MTDLLQSLPDFDTTKFSHILPSLDKHQVTLSDLLTLDAIDVARRAQVPPSEVRKLADAALSQLQGHLGVSSSDASAAGLEVRVREDWETISTLDDDLDQALGGGIPARYLTEIVGESGAGKTQFLLTLLLSVQLPGKAGGLDSSAMYISTESALSTARLRQMLQAHPRLSSLSDGQKPSLNRILTMQTPDLESQDHILRYQAPVAIKRHGVRLVVIDSIAANYRAEFEKQGGRTTFDVEKQDRAGSQAMAARRAQLIQLGALLRDLAREQNVAIVVANQVADRFFHAHASRPEHGGDLAFSQPNGEASQSTPYTQSVGSSTAPATLQQLSVTQDLLTLDHQQRFFTGWGDILLPPSQLKTPSLGLVWANQLAARIALTRDPGAGSGGWSQAAGMKGRRWMRVVFSSWCSPTEHKGVEFEIWGGGVRAPSETGAPDAGSGLAVPQSQAKRAKLDESNEDGLRYP